MTYTIFGYSGEFIKQTDNVLEAHEYVRIGFKVMTYQWSRN